MQTIELAAVGLLLCFVGSGLHELAHWLACWSLGVSARFEPLSWSVRYDRDGLGAREERFILLVPYGVGVVSGLVIYLVGQLTVPALGLLIGLLIPSRDDLQLSSG